MYVLSAVQGIDYDWIATVITLPRDDTGVKMTKLQKLEKMFNSNADFPPGYFLHAARICTGLSRGMLASKMGISVVMLANYEQGKSKIPPRIMLQIFLFGLDFYRRASTIKE